MKCGNKLKNVVYFLYMHIQKISVLLSVVYILALPIALYASPEKQVFRFAYENVENYPAFVGDGETIPDENPGVYVEILREVADRLAIELELVRMPWQRCLLEIERGQVDAINSSVREERRQIGVFPATDQGLIDQSRHITRDAYHLYKPPQSTIYWDNSQQEFRGIPAELPIGTPMGYSIGNQLREIGAHIIENPGGVPALVSMLNAGRIAGLVSHERPTDYFLELNPDLQMILYKTNPPLREDYYHILMSHQFYSGHTELAERIWDTIALVREEMLENLYQKYEQLRESSAR
ncbi:hypothetical protein JCM12856_04850 [Spirochaeta dissipatitropha]